MGRAGPPEIVMGISKSTNRPQHNDACYRLGQRFGQCSLIAPGVASGLTRISCVQVNGFWCSRLRPFSGPSSTSSGSLSTSGHSGRNEIAVLIGHLGHSAALLLRPFCQGVSVIPLFRRSRNGQEEGFAALECLWHRPDRVLLPEWIFGSERPGERDEVRVGEALLFRARLVRTAAAVRPAASQPANQQTAA